MVSCQANDMITIFALLEMENTSKMISRMLLPVRKSAFRYQIIHFS